MRVIFLTLLAAATAHADVSLDAIFETGSADAFIEAHQEAGFRWVSATHDSARAVRTGMTFHGMSVIEAIARFDHDQLKDVTLSLYNRGDAGEMLETEFGKLMAGVDGKLTSWTGMKGVTFRSQERTASATIQRKSWIKEPYRIDLVWSLSEKSRQQNISAVRPEYARLEIMPFDPTQDPRKSILVGTTGQPKLITAMELKARVKREANGDVVIPGVPMVDQGHKGYCAAAVAERVLRYYGRNLDQHEIAQLANTTAGAGTNPDQMIAALRRIGDETRLDVTVLADFNGREFEKTVADYNHAAKRTHKPEVQFMQRVGNTIYIESPVAVYHEMDTDLLREARLKRDGPMLEFKNSIARYINNGAPLAWSVVIGKVKESPDPQGFGGHMRMIIGYNDRAQEILYTDTWGAGHELKRMPLADAWTVTLGLYSLQPREVRF